MDESKKEDQWFKQVAREAFYSRDRSGHDYVEVTNLPKNIDGRSLTSLIVSGSRLLPLSTDICIKQDAYDGTRQVAIIRFKSEPDAMLAIARLKQTSYGKSWQMKIIGDPQYVEPEF